MQSRLIVLTALVLSAFAAPATSRADSIDLIENGSFEVPWRGLQRSRVLLTIPGWTTTFGTGIEIQGEGIVGIAFTGFQRVELDSDGNSGMAQTLETLPGRQYRLSFAYLPREGSLRPPDTNDIEVYFDGELLDTLTGQNPTPWTVYRYRLFGVGTTTLEFRAVGTSDTLGGLIDDVHLFVPEPAAGALAAAAVAALAAAGRSRRHGRGTVAMTSSWPLAMLLVLAAQSANALSVTAHVNADNHYGLYHGLADGSGLTLVGRNEVGTPGNPGTFNWSLPETWSFDADPAEHLYVLAWDDGGPQMWIGDFSWASGALVSNRQRWEYAVAAGPNPGELGPLPPLATVAADIAGATWQTPDASVPNAEGPNFFWFNAPLPGVDPAARILWHDRVSDDSASDDHYVLFRTRTSLGEVPAAPATDALAIALGGAAVRLAGMRARRSRCRHRSRA